MPSAFARHRDGLAAIAAPLGWTFGSHRTDRPPHLALLALYGALSADRRPLTRIAEWRSTTSIAAG